MTKITYRYGRSKSVEFLNGDPAELLKDMAWFVKNMEDNRFIDIRFETRPDEEDDGSMSTSFAYYGCIYYDYFFENWNTIAGQE